jgi:hypothetical protein
MGMPDRDIARVRIIRAGNRNKESLKYYTYRQNTKCVPDYCRDAGVLLPEQFTVWSRDDETPVPALNDGPDPDDTSPEGDVTKQF